MPLLMIYFVSKIKHKSAAQGDTSKRSGKTTTGCCWGSQGITSCSPLLSLVSLPSLNVHKTFTHVHFHVLKLPEQNHDTDYSQLPTQRSPFVTRHCLPLLSHSLPVSQSPPLFLSTPVHRFNSYPPMFAFLSDFA